MSTIFPAAIYLLGAPVIPFLKGNARKVFMVFVALAGLINILLIEPQTSWQYSFLGLNLILLHADKLSLFVGYIFALIGLLGVIYSLNAEEKGLHTAAFLYMGSSLGAVFAGDFFTLYIFWEIMALTSTAIVWSRQDEKATETGFRYLIMHLAGGVILLAGILTHYASTGSIEVTAIRSGLPVVFFLIGVGLNAWFIPLHTWLPDAYPTAPLAGSVFMSVYTTKTAVYLLARTLSGMEIVAYMGAIMAVYGVSFALMQNNARRLLSYHIISQVGYMVAAIGIGGAMGINGAILHLFNNLLYKTALFMGIGAVLYRTGKEELTELGGLVKKMPVTTVAVSIAAISISGMTLFNGFVSKGMIFEAAHGNDIIYLMLELAAVGTFLSFLKLTYFGFFRRNEKIEAKEAPLSMTIPMVVVAFFCVLIGVYPGLIVDILPYPVPSDFHFYSLGHVAGVWELLGVTAVIFFVAKRYYAPHKRVTLDFDYFYMKVVNGLADGLRSGIGLSSSFINTTLIWAKTLANNLGSGSAIDQIVALNDYIGKAYEFMVLKPVGRMASYCLTFDLGIIDGIVNWAAWVARFAAWVSHKFDIYIVDGIINSIATLVSMNSVMWRRLQTGYLQNYALVIVIGVILIIGGWILG